MIFFKKKIISALLTLLLLTLLAGFFLISPWGRPVKSLILLVPEVTPNFPVKLLTLFSSEPNVSEVKVNTSIGETTADIYRPADNKKHPAVVFTLGTLVTRKDAQVVKFGKALSRVGFVVLIPDLPDFLSGIVWTDSVETLISSVEYLDRQEFVDRQKIGFAGFCVGASASIVAAEDKRIADKVAFISAVSPYFDLFSTVDAIVTRKTPNESGNSVKWEPADLTVLTFYNGFINYIQNQEQKDLLKVHFLNEKEFSEEEMAKLTGDSRIIYEILSSKDKESLDEQMKVLPQGGKDLLTALSPSAKIGDLRAKLFIINDKKDTYVPENEGRKFKENIVKDNVYFIEVDSFEHVNPSTHLKRWSALKQVFYLSRYLYNVFSFVN